MEQKTVGETMSELVWETKEGVWTSAIINIKTNFDIYSSTGTAKYLLVLTSGNWGIDLCESDSMQVLQAKAERIYQLLRSEYE